MLYIITSRSATRRQTCGSRIISAEESYLVPSIGLTRAFNNDWDKWPTPTSDDRRCTYEYYRRVFRKEIDANPIAKKHIEKIRAAVKSGGQMYLTVNEQRKFPNSVRRLLVEIFAEHGLGLDIETDRRIDPLRVRDMDPLSAGDTLPTTSITYESIADIITTRYVTVIGAISPEQIARIRKACPNNEFVPYAVGMPEVKVGEIWAEFNSDDTLTFMTGSLRPDQETTVEDLTKLFEKSAEHWDTWAKQTDRWEAFNQQKAFNLPED